MNNQSCVDKYFSDLTGIPNISIDAYCPLYDSFVQYDHVIDHTIGCSMAVTGAVGLINSILTLITFSDTSSFTGPSFVYHRVMALVEIVHMAVMCQYGLLRELQFPGKSASMVFWRDCCWGGWVFGDAAKLCINCLTTLVSVERVIAVWLTLHFDLVNNYPVAIGAVIASFLISFLQLTTLISLKLSDIRGYYTCEQTEFGASALYLGTQNGIYFMKLVMGGMTFVMCIFIVVGMYKSKKRAAEMSSDARNRWQIMKMSCYLQLIVAVSGLIDQVAWVAFKIIYHPYPLVGRDAVDRLDSLDVAVSELARMCVARIVEVIQVFAAEIDHGGRFYFYIIFHGTFRRSCQKMWKRFKSKNQVVPVGNGA